MSSFKKYLEMTGSGLYKKNFEKGSSTYTCSSCGKKTRDTGIGEKQVELCKKCYEQIEKENKEEDERKVNE